MTSNLMMILVKKLFFYYLRETLTTEASNHFSFKELFLVAKKFGNPLMIVVILKDRVMIINLALDSKSGSVI